MKKRMKHIGLFVATLILLLLFVTGLVLKLAGIWTASWWFVTAPLWLSSVIALCTIGLATLVLLFIANKSRYWK